MSNQNDHTIVRLRVPPELKKQIEIAAEENNRSQSAEMVSRLEQSFNDDSQSIDDDVERLSDMRVLGTFDGVIYSLKRDIADTSYDNPQLLSGLKIALDKIEEMQKFYETIIKEKNIKQALSTDKMLDIRKSLAAASPLSTGSYEQLFNIDTPSPNLNYLNIKTKK